MKITSGQNRKLWTNLQQNEESKIEIMFYNNNSTVNTIIEDFSVIKNYIGSLFSLGNTFDTIESKPVITYLDEHFIMIIQPINNDILCSESIFKWKSLFSNETLSSSNIWFVNSPFRTLGLYIRFDQLNSHLNNHILVE